VRSQTGKAGLINQLRQKSDTPPTNNQIVSEIAPRCDGLEQTNASTKEREAGATGRNALPLSSFCVVKQQTSAQP
jgi:hypothetical protein